ncbi:hypothetical protein [Amycolatopsis sp. NPDC102389]|uniref:hypothetical protein n=1 Tax=Amycolatopsis sp. NPDC102389 TaxID=3363941 RepID=UPI003820BBF5
MADNIYRPPFTASFEGWSADPDDPCLWPNTVTVEAFETWASTTTGYLDAAEDIYPDRGNTHYLYADRGNTRHLVEIDTNYKPDRTSAYPVRLTRVDALRFADAVLAAVDDTFNVARVGGLRPAEARELLPFVDKVAERLAKLREHAVADGGTDPMTDPTSEEC